MACPNVFLICSIMVMILVDVSNAALNDGCANDGECAGVPNAVCTSSACACDTNYVPNNGACNQVVTGGTCPTDETACTNIDNAECSDATPKVCVCKLGTTENSGACDLLLGQACNGLTCTTSNAVCGGSNTCTCSSDYKPNDAGTECVTKDVSEITCTDSGNECDGIDNAACDTSANPMVCKCDAGYTENNNECVADVSTITCTDNGNQCDGIDNAACDTSANPMVCKCDAGYTENNNECVADVSEITCTENGNECVGIDNAECDTSANPMVCKCDDGYTENNNVCQANSGAASTTRMLGMVSLTMVIMFIRKLLI